MSSNLQLCACIVIPIAVFLGVAPRAVGDVCQGKDKHGATATHACNGISVGAPKVFDNRTLTLMLESLSQTLTAQQQSYIDQKSVLAALSNIQGFSQSETSTNLSITGTPTPATDVKTTFDTGKVDANGKPLPPTFQRQTDVNRASVTPQAPTLDTLPAFQGFNPTYGSSASDLLNDQVNLTYQIFNLKMILERSLSDRLLPGANGDNKTRLQAVMGFNVTIDPPRTANDAVAVIEITLTAKEDLSLVSLMPQEKTYNAAALSSKSNAFAGSAAVSAFQVGFSARKRSQIFYLYRDSDTVAYERMTGNPKQIVFGWMFRPVLGRRSVSPGLRQLFGIMALPNVDCLVKADEDNDHNPCKASLTSRVRTYWKKYDRATLTSFEHHDVNRAKQFWYGLTMGLATPQIFEDSKYENVADYTPLEVRSSAAYQDELKPTVTSVAWRPTGAKNIVISARGSNFFSQTTVALGDKTYSDGSGLTLKSNQAFDLITTLDALVNGPGTVLGRYDIGVPLTNQDIPAPLKNGVEIQSAFMNPPLAGIRRVEIHLQSKASREIVTRVQEARNALTEVDDVQKKIQTQLAEAPLATPPAGKKALQGAQATQATQALKSLVQRLYQIAALENKGTVAKDVKDGLKRVRESVRNTAQALDAFSAAPGVTPKDIQKALANTRAALGQTLDLIAQVRMAAQAELDKSEATLKQAHVLDSDQLPKDNQALETPIVSINGTPLDLPYQISKTTEGGLQHVVIQANVKDSVVSDSGGGIAKVSWPFYPQDKWTATYRFYNPDLAFQVTRVSQNSILINRVDGFSFTKGPEIQDVSTKCWHLIASDNEVPLKTSLCKSPPAPKLEAGKKAQALPPAPLEPPSDFVVTARLETLPDNVVLAAPNGTTYALAVPALKAKDDKAGPIELKQNDAQWIEIKAADLITSSVPTTGGTPAAGAKSPAPDLSKVTFVEANGIRLNWVPVKPEDKTASATDKTPTPSVKSIKVEITRDLTSKFGTVDIAFHGTSVAGNDLIGTRQVHITQTEWAKGDK